MKRCFDILLSTLALMCTWWIIIGAFIAASIDTGASGIFLQWRIGLNGKRFKIIKIRTMRHHADINTSVTTSLDSRITKLGRFFRLSKIDELPQLINILWGHMSFVGPRPEVPSYADLLTGDDRKILDILPGITSPATLKYRNEEILLAQQSDPEKYNIDVIYPEKIRLNHHYMQNYSFLMDIGNYP